MASFVYKRTILNIIQSFHDIVATQIKKDMLATLSFPAGHEFEASMWDIKGKVDSGA
jgi:hypothetical protein